MKKLLALFLCILLIPLPAFAMGQDVFANGQYVDRGMGEFNDYYGGPVLHIPALATARALGVPAYADGSWVTIGGKSVDAFKIGGYYNDAHTDIYMPFIWFTDNLGWRAEWDTIPHDLVTTANILLPGQKSAKQIVKSNARFNLNGEAVQFDTDVLNVNGYLYVPLRAFFEKADAEVGFPKVKFYTEFNHVVVLKGDSLLDFRPGRGVYGIRVGNDGGYFSDKNYPFIKDNRTYVPFRLCSQLLGAKVDWDASTQTASVEGAFDRFYLPSNTVHTDMNDPYMMGMGYYTPVFGL
ncbi:MAG: hypothetical protein KIB49_04075 [Clostridiales bacterium]|nr:hypothetical protein [Clostridiales bacterium]